MFDFAALLLFVLVVNCVLDQYASKLSFIAKCTVEGSVDYE